MRLADVSVEEAAGGILVHNIADAAGHKALNKGHRLAAEDVEKLRALGKKDVYVALLDPDDVREDEAVARIAGGVRGENLSATAPSSGRVNFMATTRGVLEIRMDALTRLNSLEGVALATVPGHTVVAPKKMVATLKTIGLALPERTLREADRIVREYGAAISVRAFRATRVAVILTGSPEAQERVEETYYRPICGRVEELGGRVVSNAYVAEDPGEIAGAIQRALAEGVNCIILAGQTSIMDADDISPRGIKAAGGTIELYGAPVEPGNLLLIAYCGIVPVIGAPGCVKSRETNVVDLILPRLLTGEHISRAEVIALSNGGLLI